jgi:hypothetical protein
MSKFINLNKLIKMENNCCENKGKENCCENKNNCENMNYGSCGYKKCHMIKRLLIIIIVVIAFCMGTQWGEMRAYTHGSGYGGGMMNWYK